MEKVIETIYDYAATHVGRMPTIREIGDKARMAPSVVNYHLGLLLADGRLRRSRFGAARNYEIPDALFLLPEDARVVRAALATRHEGTVRAEARLEALEARSVEQTARLAAVESLLNGELSDLRQANSSLEESVLLILETMTDVLTVIERHGYTRGGTATAAEWLEAALGGMAAARRAPMGRSSRPN